MKFKLLVAAFCVIDAVVRFFDGPFWAAAQLRGRLQDQIANERSDE
jgi:hypothetical protein